MIANSHFLLNAWIPLKPPSVNSLYQIIYPLRKVELKPEIRLFKTKFKEFLPPVQAVNTPILACLVNLEFYDNWYYQNGKLRKVDMSNLEKCCLDALFEALGLDDSLIFEKWSKKVHSVEKTGIQVGVWQRETLPEDPVASV